MRDAIERQTRERKVAALIFVVLLLLFGAVRALRTPAEITAPRVEHAPALDPRQAP